MKRFLTIFLCLAAISLIFAPLPYAGKATPLISSFNAGELSPKLDLRSDLEKYYSGCRTLENMIPLVEGGATRTPGTYFALETKDSSLESRLIPFQFSTIQSYVIEAGDLYFRLFKDDGLISTPDTYTKLLLHCDGTDADTTFTDTVGTHSPSAQDNAQLDTAYYKFSTASGLFDGTDDYLIVSDHADWYMGSAAFTVDFWVRFNSLPSDEKAGFFSQYVDTSNYIWCYLVDTAGSKNLYFGLKDAGDSAYIFDSWEPAVNTWYHIAIIRGWGGNVNDWALTVNGTAVATKTFTDDVPDIAADLNIGRCTHTAGEKYLDGWMDEVRFSKGVARWTANFTPPTQEYPFLDSGALTGGGGSAYEVTTTYEAEDVFEIKTVQSADYLYLFHPDYPPKTLTRTAHTSWTLGEMHTMIGDEMTITAISKAATAIVTCTTVPTSLAMGDIVYISGGDMTQVADLYFTTGTVVTGSSGTFELLGITSTGYTTYTTGATAQENLYGTEDNQPSCGAFFEQRLALGGSNNLPQTINLSMSADYDNFTTGSEDDDAIQYTILSERVDRVYWMVGLDSLLIGTVGGVWKMGATTTGAPITPSDITTKKQVTMGAKNIQPEIVIDSLLWVTRAGTSLRQLAFSFEVDKYIAPDMTRIAKHIALGDSRAESGIVQIDFQREPLPILWAVRTDGELLGMTYETQENIYAWFRVVTEGSFESIAVISEEDAEDEVWVIVNRTIDGSTVRYVEYFMPIEFFGEIEDGFFVHSGLTWDGGDAITITGITEANPAVVTAAGHTLNNGDEVRIQSVAGMTEINIGTDEAYTVASSDPDGGTFELSGVDTSSGYTTYTSGGTVSKVTNALSNLSHLSSESLAILIDGVKHDPEIVPIDSELLLHCDGTDQGTSFIDSSDSNHTVTANDDAQLDTAYYKFATASGLFDGTDDYFSISDHADWDIGTNFTIDLWAKHTSTANHPYVSQCEDNGNQWVFMLAGESGLYFGIKTANSTVVLIYGGDIDDTDWHHVAMCKVGDEYGLYLDGTQTAYTSDSDTDTFTGSLLVGKKLDAGGDMYFSGHMDEINISQTNRFNVSPNVGETDTLTVPTKPYANPDSITLEWYGNKIHVGLPYTSIVEPMKLNVGSELGTARGKKQRIHKITVGFYETGDGVEYGPDQDDLMDFEDFTSGELTTDDLEVIFHGDWGNEATISIVQEDPLPMTVLGIVPYVTLNEN